LAKQRSAVKQSRPRCGMPPTEAAGAMAALSAALRRTLTKAGLPKVAAAPVRKAPNGYITFSSEKRKELVFDSSFSAMSPPDKMKHLASLWKALNKDGQERYRQLAALAAEAAPPPPAAPPMSSEALAEVLPLKINLKSKAQMDNLTKTLAAEVMHALVSELKQGNAVSVTKLGKLTPSKPNDEGEMMITFKPSKASATDA